MKTVMIVSGESSGEFYGSLLARSLSEISSDLRMVGIGGERMRRAGVELLSGISGSFGLREALPSLKGIIETFRRAKSEIVRSSPSVLVLIDYPEFNLRLGRFAKRRGIRVLYFVSPQVWAWRKRRVRKMKGFVDRIAVILPFEEDIYTKSGIPCEFVGHPAMEEIEGMQSNGDIPNPFQGRAGRMRDGVRGNPVISLLPGSRPHELESLVPLFIEFVSAFRRENRDVQFVLPLAPNIDRKMFGEPLGILNGEGVEITEGGALKALVSSDAAVIASGTAALQAAFLGTPMVIVYKLSPFTYFVGKALVKVKYISLVNILAGKGIVPELLQHQASAGKIMEEMMRTLYDGEYRTRMISAFEELRKPFLGKHPSQRVAEMIAEIAEWAY
jgi:lipid-A-disaccharide synthase